MVRARAKEGMRHGQDRHVQESLRRISGSNHHPLGASESGSHRTRKDPSGNAPSHRVFIGDIEVGAAWEKQAQDKRPYLSVKLDDPSFTAPIFAQLFTGEGDEHDLVWSRQTRRGD